MSEAAVVLGSEWDRERRARVKLQAAADRLALAAAQYLDTGRGDIDGALSAYRDVRRELPSVHGEAT